MGVMEGVGKDRTITENSADRPRPISSWSERPALPADLGIIFLSSLVGLLCLLHWLDNTQAITSNGVFKAITVRKWVNDFVQTPLDPSNYNYYPLVAALCYLLDLLGVLTGDPRRQLAIINCLFAALSLCIVYLLTHSLTRRRDIAWVAVAFHLSGAFFINLSISNEDIIPSYTFLLGSMALASVWFVNPTTGRIVLVSLLFTLAWLFEWRLMFPTLPALLAALLLAPGTAWTRFRRILLFLAVMVGGAETAMQLWGPHEGNVGTVLDLLWTGKAVGSGWGGFSTLKLAFLWIGITEYLLGGANLTDLSQLGRLYIEVGFATLIISGVAIGSLLVIWRSSGSLNVRVAATVFGITFLAGEIFNLYSQPQDPQMQINVMIWLTIGWAAIAWAAASKYGPAVPKVAIAVSTLILSYNIYRVAPARGAGSQWRDALERIETHTDPTRTVFLVHGFEQFTSETFYEWHGEWDYLKRLAPAPVRNPKIKLLVFVNGPIHSQGPRVKNSPRSSYVKSSTS